MTDQLVTSVVTVLTAIIGVAIIAILVSRQSQTGAVLQQGGAAFSKVLGTALSPVTGGGGISLTGFTGLGPGLNIGF